MRKSQLDAVLFLVGKRPRGGKTGVEKTGVENTGVEKTRREKTGGKRQGGEIPSTLSVIVYTV